MDDTRPALADGTDLLLRAASAEEGNHAFEVVWEGEQVGRVELLADDTGDAELIWAVVPEYRAVGVVERALRLVVEWAFAELGTHRVEARVDDADRDGVRAALRAGLRKEGVARSSLAARGSRADVLVQIGRASCRKECRSRWSPYH